MRKSLKLRNKIKILRDYSSNDIRFKGLRHQQNKEIRRILSKHFEEKKENEIHTDLITGFAFTFKEDISLDQVFFPEGMAYSPFKMWYRQAIDFCRF